MKFSITLKDPDRFYEGVQEAAEADVASVPGLDDEERSALVESRRKKIGEAIARWVQYGEYVTIEFDTEAHTATVREVRR